jgi:hypothetical protein
MKTRRRISITAKTPCCDDRELCQVFQVFPYGVERGPALQVFGRTVYVSIPLVIASKEVICTNRQVGFEKERQLKEKHTVDRRRSLLCSEWASCDHVSIRCHNVSIQTANVGGFLPNFDVICKVNANSSDHVKYINNLNFDRISACYLCSKGMFQVLRGFKMHSVLGRRHEHRRPLMASRGTVEQRRTFSIS